MATVKKRNDKYVVIYDYTDNDGKRRQKWETFNSKPEANKRKSEVELEKLNNQFVKPTGQTVSSFFTEWAEMYSKGHWQAATYTVSMGIINNHILPELGDKQIQKVTPYDIEKFLDNMRRKKIGGVKGQGKSNDELPCLSPTTVRYAYILLKQAFDKAVEWKLIQETPVRCDAPVKSNTERGIWDGETVKLALDDIDHPQLHLAVHMAFICSMRPGEMLGLTWDCVNFGEKYIRVNKTLQRVSKKALAVLPKDDIYKLFPEKVEETRTVLALKKVKTKKSKRIIYITDQLAAELLSRKQTVENEKRLSGYQDHNMVFALQDGAPVECHLCEKWFKKWQQKTELDVPPLIMHELRHSSTTYKLLISGGDIKTVQGDTGHASADMVVDVYSHMQDKNRSKLTEKMGKEFYNGDDAVQDTSSGSEADCHQNKLPMAEGNIDVSALIEFMGRIREANPLLHKNVLTALTAHND